MPSTPQRSSSLEPHENGLIYERPSRQWTARSADFDLIPTQTVFLSPSGDPITQQILDLLNESRRLESLPPIDRDCVFCDSGDMRRMRIHVGLGRLDSNSRRQLRADAGRIRGVGGRRAREIMLQLNIADIHDWITGSR